MSGLTRAGDLTVGDTTWTDAELADKGCPCLCGIHPDDHRAIEDDEEEYIAALVLGVCPCYYPDIEALCETCSGTGGGFYTTDSGFDVDTPCETCDGTGLKPQGRHLR